MHERLRPEKAMTSAVDLASIVIVIIIVNMILRRPARQRDARRSCVLALGGMAGSPIANDTSIADASYRYIATVATDASDREDITVL